MNEKMKDTIDTSLEVLDIYAKRILDMAKKNAKDPLEMDRNLRILNVIGSDMERLQRLQTQKPEQNLDD